ncbi:hypothetical protein AALP_AA1G043300 [Arabis alpina]|uniref:Uncharacterized protein n=1 Tax=Arabis alpina TaxID=50452 RepID=A0A087HL16_ARAAL|nr:hypothetical protein AALP_AA1G043300 [Arabis alpina]
MDLHHRSLISAAGIASLSMFSSVKSTVLPSFRRLEFSDETRHPRESFGPTKTSSIVNRELSKPVVMKISMTKGVDLESPSRLSTVASPLVATPLSLPPPKPPDPPNLLVSRIRASNNIHRRNTTSPFHHRQDLPSTLSLWPRSHGEIFSSHFDISFDVKPQHNFWRWSCYSCSPSSTTVNLFPCSLDLSLSETRSKNITPPEFKSDLNP